jgi:teichuronic acid biosynthesis glycosyltransferase TuaC
MRVLVLTNMWPTAEAPAFGTFVERQVAGLRARGVEVDVLFVNGRASRWNYLLGLPRFWGKLLRGHYDLVHAHYVFSGWLARLQLAVPVVVSFHGAGEMEGYQGWLCRRLAPLVAGCTVTSPRHKEQLGWPAARIVRCGVDLDRFIPQPQAEARRRLGLPQEGRLVLYVGELRPEKRVELLEAAVAQVAAEQPGVSLVKVVGRPHDQIPWYMNAGDVLALVSDYEGSPVVIKEAMAVNLPIVATSTGDVREVLGGIPGTYLCTQAVEDIAAKLRQALAFGGRTAGRARVSQLRICDEVDGVAEMYGEVVKMRRTRSAKRETQ